MDAVGHGTKLTGPQARMLLGRFLFSGDQVEKPVSVLSGGGGVMVMPGATLGGYGSVSGAVTNDGTIAAGNAVSQFAGGPVGNFTIKDGRGSFTDVSSIDEVDRKSVV